MAHVGDLLKVRHNREVWKEQYADNEEKEDGGRKWREGVRDRSIRRERRRERKGRKERGDS